MAINQEITFRIFSRAHTAHCVWGDDRHMQSAKQFCRSKRELFHVERKISAEKMLAMVWNALCSKKKASKFRANLQHTQKERNTNCCAHHVCALNLFTNIYVEGKGLYSHTCSVICSGAFCSFRVWITQFVVVFFSPFKLTHSNPIFLVNKSNSGYVGLLWLVELMHQLHFTN